MEGNVLVSREEAFAESIFQCINKNSYDKAKDLCDKERESEQKGGRSAVWLQFVSCLGQLSAAEKTYTSLLYLAASWFSKNKTLRTTFQGIQSELRSINDQPLAAETEAANRSLCKIIGHLSGQLVQYITCRIKMMDFYEQVSTMGHHRLSNHEDLLVVIKEIFKDHEKGFHHPILSPLRSAFVVECDVLISLLSAQVQMSECNFLTPLLSLNTAHTRLTAHANAAPPREARKLTFPLMKAVPQTPALYQWLRKFLSLLLAKFTLYNYEVLSKQGSDIKIPMSKNPIDLYTKVKTFQHKTEALCVSVVLDTSQVSHPVQKKPGYTHPQRKVEPLQGIDSYHPLFCQPPDRPDRYWPAVVNLIIQKRPDLQVNKPGYLFDHLNQTTYYLSGIDQKLTLVIIYDSKKSEKDSYVTNFIAEIVDHLKCSKLYGSLRPGTK